MSSFFIQLFLFIFPWKIRCFFLVKMLKFEIAEGARIGFSILLARHVILKKHSSIGHLNFCKAIDLLELGEYSKIGTKNYITGFSVYDKTVLRNNHFFHVTNRQCVLKVGNHTGITSRHYFDCNGGIFIGNFCQIAGFESAFLTHSIDLKNNRQDADSIIIEDYSFIGTRCTFLKKSKIPSRSVVSACSLVNKQYQEENSLYGGIPCKFIKTLDNYKFFYRTNGSVN